MRILVIGGVAGGMSAAARARRLDEHAEIIVFEKGRYVSFANCGLPYHVGGEIEQDSYLLLHSPESLKAELDLDVRIEHEVIGIDRDAQTVLVATPEGTETFEYDALVLSPGADAIVPPIPGVDLPEVTHLRTVDEARELAGRTANAKRAVVMGAGFIGLETAEAFRHRGLEVTLVELAPQVLPPLAPEMSALVEKELTSHGVDVRAGVAATGIRAGGDDAAVTVTLGDGTEVPADIVVMSVGVRPNTALAGEAGLELTDRGAIVVDEFQQTSDAHIWAAGDAIAVRHGVTGQVGPVPLAGPANRQGRRAADSIMGRSDKAQPVLGTAIVRTFGLTAATTGASPRMLDQAGIEYFVVHTHPANHAGYYPGSQVLHLMGVFSPEGKLLGAQAVGPDGADKRIDVLATALRAGFSADDIAELELAYAPPFGSAKDPVNMLGFLAQNVVNGTTKVWTVGELDWARDNALILDVRSEREYAMGHLPEAVNLPHTHIREYIEGVKQIAAGRPVRVLCASGVRSYYAHRVLAQHGLDSATLDGGMFTLVDAVPGLELATGAFQPA
ncbi:FAD-dependent oxidoreductase [Demequina sp. SYSU T00192]|uniref:FAD-dependent oxidoreductase n=1 Tax=Demequina litoralis TaxID=3051660 RepID=A0ABT8G8J9_9MICO|nr:FAD-dependent oxidoreductase [Demequina sp. SYSU T00192]MDN4475465.1 FAD-dependent oxidoreductase [Demequina sp. SYSU T00192]